MDRLHCLQVFGYRLSILVLRLLLQKDYLVPLIARGVTAEVLLPCSLILEEIHPPRCWICFEFQNSIRLEFLHLELLPHFHRWAYLGIQYWKHQENLGSTSHCCLRSNFLILLKESSSSHVVSHLTHQLQNLKARLLSGKPQ